MMLIVIVLLILADAVLWTIMDFLYKIFCELRALNKKFPEYEEPQ